MKRDKSKSSFLRYTTIFFTACLVLFVSACGDDNISDTIRRREQEEINKIIREEEERIIREEEERIIACELDNIPIEECDF